MSGFSFVSLLNPKLNSFSVDSKRIRLQKKKYDIVKLCQKTKKASAATVKCL